MPLDASGRFSRRCPTPPESRSSSTRPSLMIFSVTLSLPVSIGEPADPKFLIHIRLLPEGADRMDLGHRGARVIVTGGGANIGRGIALGFAAEGARLLVADIDGPQAEADVAATVIGQMIDDWGGVDVLVNNAGWSKPGFFADQTDRGLWQRTIEVNLYTAFACTQAVLGPMREAGGGAVVFISSDSAFGAVRQGIYGSTKAGLISLARTVARENGRYGIRSNVIAPGLVVPEDAAQAGPHSVWAHGSEEIFTQDQADYVLRQQ